MKILKPILLFLLMIAVAIVASSVISHIRADQIAAATYSIWFNEYRPYGTLSPSALAGLTPEKLKLLKTVVPTRQRFDGQRANGDSIEIVSTDDGVQNKAITFLQQGISVLTNNRNSNISTTGTGVPFLLKPVTPMCLAWRDSRIVPEDDTILGFHTLHVTIQDHGMISDKWYSRDLGCQVLKSVSTRQSDGAVEDIEATSASADPPADSMFALPNNPVEMSPSNYWLALTPPDAGHNKASDAISTPYYEQQDAIYASDRSARATSTSH